MEIDMIYRGYVVRWSGASSTFGIVQQKYPDKLCQYVLDYRAACHRDIDEVNYHTTVLQASLASNDYNNDKNYNIFIAPKK